jgi:hypothetical protein
MNIKIKSHIVPITIIITCILVGFSIFKLYLQPVKEGLEDLIKREDGKLVKRRKKIVIEGLSGPFSFLGDIAKIFKKIGKAFSTIGQIFGYVPKLFTYLSKYIGKVCNNLTQAFQYIPRVFIWLGSYITGGLRFITNLNKCFGWYFLDTLGKTIYLPIKFLFWLFSLTSIEDMVWDFAESFDCIAKKYTGYHLIHYSDSIQDRCYSFCPDEFPKFPKLDWKFNPPTLRLNW